MSGVNAIISDIPSFIKGLKLYPTLSFLKKHGDLIVALAIVVFLVAVVESIIVDIGGLVIKKNPKVEENDENDEKMKKTDKETSSTKDEDNKNKKFTKQKNE